MENGRTKGDGDKREERCTGAPTLTLTFSLSFSLSIAHSLHHRRRRVDPKATGDSRISINPNYKSNSLNTKVTRKGNPRDPTRRRLLRPKSFPLYKYCSTQLLQYCPRNIKPDKENALISLFLLKSLYYYYYFHAMNKTLIYGRHVNKIK